MNRRAAWMLLTSTWATWMQSRGFFFLLAFGWMIPPLIYLFVWSTAAGGGAIGGLTRGEFVAYYLLLILVNQLTYAQTNWTVGDEIRDGRINTLLLRPIPPLYHALMTELAGKAIYMSFVTPVAIALSLILHPELHLTLSNSVAFLPALLLAWLLRFFWGFWLALLAFWTARADALLAVQDTLVFLFAGQVAPIALLPDAMHTLAIVLPFRYMVSFPIEIATNQLRFTGILSGFAWQCGWLILALTLSAIVWRRGLRHHTAVGG